MTAQPIQPNTDKISAQELRELFAAVVSRLDQVESQLESMRNGLTAAASKQTASAETFKDFEASEIILGYDDKGEPTYKIKGVPFTKYGVRVWPEILPELGIDPTSLKPGPNPFKCQVRALMFEAMSESGTTSTQPKKIIGKA